MAACLLAIIPFMAEAMTEKRRAQFVDGCMEQWTQIMPPLKENGQADRMCNCMLKYVGHMDDAISNEEALNRAVGPPDMDARPEVYPECVVPAMMSVIPEGEQKEELRRMMQEP